MSIKELADYRKKLTEAFDSLCYAIENYGKNSLPAKLAQKTYDNISKEIKEALK